MVVVEVRQGTLGVDNRGWGPAGNIEYGWSWMRSDREYCASRVAIGQEEDDEEEAGRRGGRRQEIGGRKQEEEEEEDEEQAT